MNQKQVIKEEEEEKTKQYKKKQTSNPTDSRKKCRQRIRKRKATAQKVGIAVARVSAKSCNTRTKMNRTTNRIDIDHCRPHRPAPEPCSGDIMLSGNEHTQNKTK